MILFQIIYICKMAAIISIVCCCHYCYHFRLLHYGASEDSGAGASEVSGARAIEITILTDDGDVQSLKYI